MASNTLTTRRDPVQGLVDYVNDVKPFHSKIVDVLIEYIYQDDVNVTIRDDIHFHVDIELQRDTVFSNDGFDSFPWGLLDDGSDPSLDPGNPGSGYVEYNSGFTAGVRDGSDFVNSSWDWIANPDVAGQTTILATITDELAFTDGNELFFSDTLAAYVNDDEAQRLGWDSGIRAYSIVGMDHTNDQIILAGRHEASRDGVLLDGQSGRSYSLGYPGHPLAFYGTTNNDGMHTVVTSFYNPIEHRTYITVTPSLNRPVAIPLDGSMGRVADAASIYFDPRIGYEGPFPYDPQQPAIGRDGWDTGGWDTSGNRVGNRISESLMFDVNTSTDTFTLSSPGSFETNDVVYLSGNGTMPKFQSLNNAIEILPYVPYYYIKITDTQFKLTLQKDGQPLDIISSGTAPRYIGPGRQVSFIEVAIGQQEDSLVSVESEGLTVSNEILMSPSSVEVIRVEVNGFVVSGDYSATYLVGSTVEISESYNNLNDGQWVVSASSYNDEFDETTLTVEGPSPNQTSPYGKITGVTNGRDGIIARTTFQDTISFHVDSIDFTDEITVTMVENNAYGLYGLSGITPAYDVGVFGVGGFDGDFL